MPHGKRFVVASNWVRIGLRHGREIYFNKFSTEMDATVEFEIYFSENSWILFPSGFYFLRILVRSAQPSQIGAKKENQRSAWATGIYAAH